MTPEPNDTTGATHGAKTTRKGNTIIPELWVTHHDTDWGPYLWGASLKPWDEDYRAPITGWADNTRFVNSDLSDALARRAVEAALRDAKHLMSLLIITTAIKASEAGDDASPESTRLLIRAFEIARNGILSLSARDILARVKGGDNG